MMADKPKTLNPKLLNLNRMYSTLAKSQRVIGFANA